MQTALKQGAVWDFLLCLAASSALAITIEAGFNVLQAPEVYAATVLGCAVVLGLVLVVSKRFQSALAAVVAFICACAVAAVAASVLSTTPNLIEDSPDNLLIPTLITVLSSGMTYAFTRHVGTCVAFFIVGFFICSAIQFLYHEGHLPADIVFLLSSLAMIAYRNFSNSLCNANALSKMGFGSGFVSAVALAAVLVALAGCVFVVVVAPLDPPAATLKLIQEYRKLPEIHARHPMEISEEVDERITSSRYDDAKRTTTYEKPGEDGFEIHIDTDAAPQNKGDATDKEQTEDDDSKDPNSKMISFGSTPDFPVLLLIAAMVLMLAAGSVLLKKLLRRRWFVRTCRLSPSDQVGRLYRFFLSRFDKMGFGKSAVQTPLEYAALQQSSLAAFAENGDVAYGDLTATFLDTAYGNHSPSPEQVQQFHRFYGSFYKNCVGYLGRIKYIRKFFFL